MHEQLAPVIDAWTDYPITALGDIDGEKAPIRPCQVLAYDRNKYCLVRMVGGITTEIKAGYIYREPGRCGSVPRLTPGQLLSVQWFGNFDNKE